MSTIQEIFLGSYANDGTGDDLRTAFIKVNANFAALNVEVGISTGVNVGGGTGVFKSKSATNLEFKTLTSTDNSVVITNTANTVNLQGTTSLARDTTPTLAGNLNLNSRYIYGGDTQTTIYGIDPNVSNSLFSVAMSTTPTINADFGTIPRPTGWQRFAKGFTVDLNGTSTGSGFTTPLANDYDFGALAETGIKVSGNILSLGTNLTATGTGNITLTSTGITNVTLPASGVLATSNGRLDQFALTNSVQLRSVISDETGSGSLVFATNPTLVTPDIGNATASGINTTQTTFNLVNTAATTIAFGGAATTLSVGANTGTTTVKNNLSVIGNLSVTGTVQITGLQGANYITVSSTATYALSTTVVNNILLVTASGYTATLTFPPTPADGQVVRFVIHDNTVGLALTAGATLSGAFATSVIAPYAAYEYIYRTSNTTWYRIQ
jgi:hypothetical protein